MATTEQPFGDHEIVRDLASLSDPFYCSLTLSTPLICCCTGQGAQWSGTVVLRLRLVQIEAIQKVHSPSKV